MKCVKCGKKLRKNEKFCTYCGYYNDAENTDNWNESSDEENLLEENWYDDDIDIKEEKDDIDIKQKKEVPKKVKKEKEIKLKEIKLKEDNELYDENEKYIEAYIGEDYKIIKKSPFNIYAFLLNWMYFLYRKLYITGIIGLIITAVVAFFYTKYFLIYLIIILILIGFGFNPYYIFIIKRRVNKILKDYEGSDSFSLEKTCSELGGVNVIISLIIYLIFLLVIILSMFKPAFNTSHNDKFWKENSENQANCTSLVRLAYKEEKANYNKIEEALCKVNKNENKYELYLKAKKNKNTVYVYYETEKEYIVYKKNTELLNVLEKREKEKIISEEDKKFLKDIRLIISNYNSIHKISIKEDKLIKEKTNREEKVNYIFDYEDLIK